MEGSSSEKILLQETFYLVAKKKCIFRVKLLENGLSLEQESQNNVRQKVIPIADIIGCQVLRSKKQSTGCYCQSLPRSNSRLKVVEETSNEIDNGDISAYLYIYAYVMQALKGNTFKRERTVITLRFRSFDVFEDNHKEAQKWRTCIKMLIKGDILPALKCSNQSCQYKETRKLLVLCNPKSGPGKGKIIFQQKVLPLLREAEISYDLHVTSHANFAREFVRTHDIYQWTGILLVGGDGIVFEVINGIFERWDWQKCIEAIPIGVIPGGSGNGLARSIAHHSSEPYSPSTLPSSLAAVGNNVMPMDLVRVETKSSIMFSFLSVGWGFLSDVDIESESLRILGGQRFNIWSVARLVGLRSYKGKLSYLPADNVEITSRKNSEIFSINDSNLDLTNEMHLESQGSRQRVDSWYSAASRKTTFFSATESSYQSTVDINLDSSVEGKHHMYGPPPQIPSLTSPLPPTWNCIDGSFVMIHASYQSHLGEECLFVPDGKLNDGLIWLLVIHSGTSRAHLLSFLLGLSTGTHVNYIKSGTIEFLKVKAFRIEPDMTEEGYITVDGEHVEYGAIQAEIFPGLGRVMVP